MSRLCAQVLRPICWAGLLKKEEGATWYRTEEALFLKTPLWKASLTLDTDGEVRRILTLGIVTFAPMTIITGIWGGPFLQDTLGFSAEASGAVLLMLFAGSVVGAFLFGQLDRLIARRKAVILTAASTSSTCLLLLALLPGPGLGPAATVFLLVAIIFCQTFYISSGAHMRTVARLEVVGRASILLSLVGIAAIPIMQTGFAAILDLARTAGFGVVEQYRFSFGAMGLVMASCVGVYSSARLADDG